MVRRMGKKLEKPFISVWRMVYNDKGEVKVENNFQRDVDSYNEAMEWVKKYGCKFDYEITYDFSGHPVVMREYRADRGRVVYNIAVFPNY